MEKHKLREQFRKASTPPEGWSGDLYFVNNREQKLRYAHAPAQGIHRGTVIHRHGAGESLDLYLETIKWYQGQGFDVWAYDLSGYGLSEGKHPDHKPSAKDTFLHIDDLDVFVKKVVQHDPHKPLIMSAHSLSGHSGLLYLKKNPDVFKAAVMSSPLFDIYRLGLPVCFRPVIRGIFQLACLVGFKECQTPVAGYSSMLDRIRKTSESLTTISLGEINYRRTVKDMLKELHTERYRDRPTFGWVCAAYETLIPALRAKFLSKIDTPLLIGSAGIFEELVDTDAHARVADMTQKGELVKLPFADHNLWHDHDKNYNEWVCHVSQFLDRIAPQTRALGQEPCQECEGHCPLSLAPAAM